MRFVEETDGKSFVQVNDGTKKEEKEYASKGVAGTALGLGIAGTALWLLNGGLNGCGLFGLTEEQLDEKIIHSAINFWFEDEDAGSGKVWNYFKDI